MDINTTKTLNNGVEIPIIGLGVFKSGIHTYRAVRHALEAGYRHIDTASYYQNEEAVGKAVRDSGIDREEVFITSKLWTDDMRKRRVRQALEKSLSLLNTDYLDLYLIHWPVKEEFVNSYKVMEELRSEGKIRAIGVSNFQIHHLKTLMTQTNLTPAVNQIESHPYLNNNEVFEFCRQNNIMHQSWSPLARGKALEDAKLKVLASKYNKTVAQIIIRWHIQKGVIVIPKSVHKERIIENAEVFDFNLTDQDIMEIDKLDCDLRTGSHPDTFTF